MKYRVIYKKSAQKALKKMDRANAKLIIDWIEKHLEGTENPRIYGKALVGNYSGMWRYRVGNYRVLAVIEDSTVSIEIMEIGHRKNIY